MVVMVTSFIDFEFQCGEERSESNFDSGVDSRYSNVLSVVHIIKSLLSLKLICFH